MSDATGVAEALPCLSGFRIRDVHESPAELAIEVEIVAAPVGCSRCGVLARGHDRAVGEYRDLAVFGRLTRLRWSRRRFRCEAPACSARN